MLRPIRGISHSGLGLIFLICLLCILFSYKCIYALTLEEIKCIPAGGAPKSVDISPDGNIAVVNNLEGKSVWIFDTCTKKILKKIKFFETPGTGFDYQNKINIPSIQEKPVECAFSNNGRFIWISLHNAGGVVVYDREEKLEAESSYKKVAINDLSENTTKIVKLPFIETGLTPKIIAVSPDENWVYVANWHSNNISVIDARILKKLKDVKVPRIPRGIVFTPDSKYAYVANMGSDCLSKIRVDSHEIIENIAIGNNPRHLVITKDGKYIYVSLNVKNMVKKFDVEKGITVAAAEVGKMPRTISLSPDGRYLFVANYDSNTIGIVDTNLMLQEKTFPVQLHPCGLCNTKDGKELWITNYYSNTVCIYKIVD